MIPRDRPAPRLGVRIGWGAGASPERLIVIPEADAETGGRFTGRLESTGEDIVANTRQPLVDGARELLARGFDPGTPLTMRLEGKAYDSFRPLPLGEWAKWTYTEPDKRGLKSQRWMPFSGARDGQKSGSEPSVVLNPHTEANSLLRAPVRRLRFSSSFAAPASSRKHPSP
jgi:hypothetical protein